MAKNIFLVLVFGFAAVLYGCAASAPVDSADENNGAQLYTEYCASCHGSLARTDRPGRSAARISSAIKYNIGGMGYLANLTDSDVESIAVELALVVPPKDATGEELYGMYCSNCHGPLGKSDIAGKTMDDVMGAASRKVCSAGNMKYLGMDEITKILDALSAEKGGS